MSERMKLLPCPFCGGDEAYTRVVGAGYQIVCDGCKVHTEAASNIEAIAAWNRRPIAVEAARSIVSELQADSDAASLSALEAEGYVVTKKDSSLSPRDDGSDELLIEVMEAGSALVTVLGDMIPAMDNVCKVSANHGVPYDGPTMGAPLRRLSGALKAWAKAQKATSGEPRGEANSTSLSAREPIK